MIIDFGGIVKGCTADVIAEFFKSKGVKHTITNFGGNVLVIGGYHKRRDSMLSLLNLIYSWFLV